MEKQRIFGLFIVLCLAVSNSFSQINSKIQIIEDGISIPQKLECSILFQMNDSTFHSFEETKKKFKSKKHICDSIVGMFVVLGQDSLIYFERELTKELYLVTGEDLYKKVLFDSKVNCWRLEIDHYPYSNASDNAPEDMNPFFSENYIEEEAIRLKISKEDVTVYVLRIKGVPPSYVWRKEINLIYTNFR